MQDDSFTCIHCGKRHARSTDKCPETGEAIYPSFKFEGLLLAERYRLKSIIGEGGMGIVYEGVHEKLGSKIAVKFLRTDLKFSEETLKRFENEAKISASLGHKNIVRIFDMGTYESTPYFVMEFLEGEPLDEIIEDQSTLSVRQAADITIQILEALNAVHYKGIIHRDLKPENVVIVPQPGGGDLVKILDFGICRLQSDACSAMRVTKTGAVFGTPYYMSPEQAEGRRDIDSRADLYSVGAMLYKMLTGRTPFTGENYNTVIVNIINREPSPPRHWNMEIPIDMDAVIRKAIARNRDERFLDASEFIEALEPFASVYVARERRSSSVSDVEEKKEPIPADIWAEEISVVVDTEASLPTLRAELEALEKGETIKKDQPAAKPYVRRKRTLSWDSTSRKIKGALARKEMAWLLPAGILVSLAGIFLLVGAFVLLTGGSGSMGGIEAHQKHAGAASSVKPRWAAGDLQRPEPPSVTTKIEESTVEMVGEETHLVSFTGLPPGAMVYVDGKEVEELPAPVEAREETHQVLVEADGYDSFFEYVEVKGDTVLVVSMKKQGKKPRKKVRKDIDITLPPIDTKYPGKKRKKK